jgi:glycerol-3-phosphate dehydrogenase subunit B
VFASDIARWFDTSTYRAEVIRSWRDKVKGVTRLGLPAILGLERAREAHHDLQDQLGVEVFEIPILPPSVPGMRLFNVLHSAIESAGGRVTIGPNVAGWVEQGQALGIIAETAGGLRRYAARHIILATGGFRHGGLESPARGQVRESVFNLPVVSAPEFFAPLYWDSHPYLRCGVRVDEHLRPLNVEGAVIYPNVFAVGGLLAGADRLGEGSREGIDLATGWKAMEQMSNSKPQNSNSQL